MAVVLLWCGCDRPGASPVEPVQNSPEQDAPNESSGLLAPSESRDPDVSEALTAQPPAQPRPAVLSGTLPPERAAEWLENVPYPSDLEWRRISSDDALPYVEGQHPAQSDDLARFFLAGLADLDWLAISHESVGSTLFVRLGRGNERLLLTVGGRDPDAHPTAVRQDNTWLSLQQQPNEPALHSMHAGGSDTCEVELPSPETDTRWQCQLRLHGSLSGIPRFDPSIENGHPAVATWLDQTGLFYQDGNDLRMIVVADGDLVHGPTTVGTLSQPSVDRTPGLHLRLLATPGGWIASWVEDERWVTTISGDLGDLGDSSAATEPTAMSRGLSDPQAWSWTWQRSTSLDEPGFSVLATWTEFLDDRPVVRVATWTGQPSEQPSAAYQTGVGTRGPDITHGPQLVAGPRGASLVWASAHTLYQLALSAHLLPINDQHRLEASVVDDIHALWADDSVYSLWNSGGRGFWVRSDQSGCRDSAYGAVGGTAQGLLITPAGVSALVGEDGELRLVRLIDDDREQPSRQPVVLGTTHVAMSWSAFDSDRSQANATPRGFVQTAFGIAPARWVCEALGSSQ